MKKKTCENVCQEKHRDFGNLPKTQIILFVQVMDNGLGIPLITCTSKGNGEEAKVLVHFHSLLHAKGCLADSRDIAFLNNYFNHFQTNTAAKLRTLHLCLNILPLIIWGYKSQIH